VQVQHRPAIHGQAPYCHGVRSSSLRRRLKSVRTSRIWRSS
jgi:hypothetical protein